TVQSQNIVVSPLTNYLAYVTKANSSTLANMESVVANKLNLNVYELYKDPMSDDKLRRIAIGLNQAVKILKMAILKDEPTLTNSEVTIKAAKIIFDNNLDTLTINKTTVATPNNLSSTVSIYFPVVAKKLNEIRNSTASLNQLQKAADFITAVTTNVIRGNSSLGAQIAQYDTTKSYGVGAIVSYNGRQYRAISYANVGESPDHTFIWKPYAIYSASGKVALFFKKALDSTTNTNTTSAPAYNIGQSYNSSDIVSYNGMLFQAKWAVNPNQVPDLTVNQYDTPWKLISQTTTMEQNAGTINNIDTNTTATQNTLTQDTAVADCINNGNCTADTITYYTISLNQDASKKVVGNYPEWAVYAAHGSWNPSSDSFKTLVQKFTHFNYAYVKIGTDSKLALIDSSAANTNLTALKKLKDSGNFGNTKFMLSIGGWNHSSEFTTTANNQANRNTFADSVVAYLKQYNFDGINIAWSRSSLDASDVDNFSELLRTVRIKLDIQGKADTRYYELSVSVPPTTTYIDYTKPDVYTKYVNFITLLAYDFHKGDEATTNHIAPLYRNPSDPTNSNQRASVSESAEYLVSKGVDKSKLVIGLAMYSRGWELAANSANPLFAAAKSAAPGPWDGATKEGIYPYFMLKNGLSGYTQGRDSVAGDVPYLYNSTTKYFYSYEDNVSLSKKLSYINSNGYAGVDYWEITMDAPQYGSELIDMGHGTFYAGQAINPAATTATTAIYIEYDPNKSYAKDSIVGFNGKNYKTLSWASENICPIQNLCADKYAAAGINWQIWKEYDPAAEEATAQKLATYEKRYTEAVKPIVTNCGLSGNDTKAYINTLINQRLQAGGDLYALNGNSSVISQTSTIRIKDIESLKRSYFLPCLVDLSNSANIPANVTRIKTVLTEQIWNDITANKFFSENAQLPKGPYDANSYTYSNFLQNIARAPYVCDDAGIYYTDNEAGKATACQREIAALFAHALQETGNAGEFGTLFSNLRETGRYPFNSIDPTQYYDSARCYAGSPVCNIDEQYTYYGRGMHQTTWWYNYLPLSAAY
ncbi:MAG: hypothetical protein RL154_181, partial [Pseudomonadota bacterium]